MDKKKSEDSRSIATKEFIVEEIVNDMIKKKTNETPDCKYKDSVKFCNNSSYKGQWNSLGMQGIGNYNFFYGVRFFGYMVDGQFYDKGSLYYPNGTKILGIWKNGTVTVKKCFYPDKLKHGSYCKMPDRRFHLERLHGLRPAGRSLKTNDYHSRKIPPGCYDTVDGFYDPVKKYVFDPNDHKKIVRIPTDSEHLWIIKHCRKAWDEPVGYRPDLFINWTQYRPELQKKRQKKEYKYVNNLLEKHQEKITEDIERCYIEAKSSDTRVRRLKVQLIGTDKKPKITDLSIDTNLEVIQSEGSIKSIDGEYAENISSLFRQIKNY